MIILYVNHDPLFYFHSDYTAKSGQRVTWEKSSYIGLKSEHIKMILALAWGFHIEKEMIIGRVIFEIS